MFCMSCQLAILCAVSAGVALFQALLPEAFFELRFDHEHARRTARPMLLLL